MAKTQRYITLNTDQLEKLHEDMLSLLIEVDQICRKHNINYFLSDGTLLGAVRHKGYIPWDDDIDIQMLRKDYDRFAKICEKELDNDRFFFQSHQTDKHYNWVYGKLRLKGTSYIRAGQEHIKQKDGIFMDIFPLDDISTNKQRQKVAMIGCKLCRKALWAQVGKVDADTVASRSMFRLVSFLPKKWIVATFNYFAKRDNGQETSVIASHNLSGHIFKKEWYLETTELEFEGHYFFAPKKYHDILTSVYGNYMELPPVEKRQGHCLASYIRYLDGTELKVKQ